MCICQWWHDKHNKSVDVKFIPESTCMDSRYTDTRIYIIYIFILESITNSFPSFFPSPTPHNIRPKFRCGASAITWFGSWSTDPGSKQTSGTYPKRPSTSQPLFFYLWTVQPSKCSYCTLFGALYLSFLWCFLGVFLVGISNKKKLGQLAVGYSNLDVSEGFFHRLFQEPPRFRVKTWGELLNPMATLPYVYAKKTNIVNYVIKEDDASCFIC